MFSLFVEFHCYLRLNLQFGRIKVAKYGRLSLYLKFIQSIYFSKLVVFSSITLNAI